MAGMNWSRARMDDIIGQRGSERFSNDFEPAPSRPPAPRKTKKKSKGKTRGSSSCRPRKPRPAPASSLKVERRALRREFEQLTRQERVERVGEFKARLRTLSGSETVFASLWRTNFQPLLRARAAVARSTKSRPQPPRSPASQARPARAGKRGRTSRALAAEQSAAAPAARQRRAGLANGVGVDASVWVIKGREQEPGILYTAVGEGAARVAVWRDGEAVLRLVPTGHVAPRAGVSVYDRALRRFIAHRAAPASVRAPQPGEQGKSAGKRKRKGRGPSRPASLSYVSGGARPRATFWRGRA